MENQFHTELAPVELSTLMRLGIAGAHLVGSAQSSVIGIVIDSREVTPGVMFAAITGHNGHGMQYLQEALERGAVAILTDPVGLEMFEKELAMNLDVPVVVIPDPRAWIGEIANAIYGGAAEKLRLLGVTGTNGKTTTATMIEAALINADRDVAFVGTTGIRIGTQVLDSSRTTPEATTLHSLFAHMLNVHVSDVVMEVSSHGLSEHRVGGMHFEVVGFTNLSQDHLDYHRTMEAYFEAKRQLFRPEHASRGVVCIDSTWGERLATEATIPVSTVSATGKKADWVIDLTSDARSKISGPLGEQAELQLLLPGEFNRANALLAYAMLRSIDVPSPAIVSGLNTVQVAGRLEQVQGSNGAAGIEGFVDYAHTPDAVERVLTAVRELTAGRVIVVLGAGGDRDATKRPLMGQMAARLADHLVVTDDNPRSEDPALIRAAVLAGANTASKKQGASVLEVGDRSLAITTAVKLASAGDVVVILGKGHEQGQDVAGVVTPFDDRVVLGAALLEINAGAL
ncbi:MAG: UDP-N-acetylmuramoyl-L-alanyl-D-glutamate--2,6-diaminopimelate ligase [Actinobacteria bacterium]|uniref:Unannotated protein n=1 Tax=freshwater metagenome TaxID=449393 RepID=A0A6J7FLI9_9ZZZZ|nr:UDP-N-acetylmuramoyl-L-alanyl-D-glutamate--2,6-diaminopimelate ligase [Actinomycetota bacterium]